MSELVRLQPEFHYWSFWYWDQTEKISYRTPLMLTKKKQKEREIRVYLTLGSESLMSRTVLSTSL